MELQASVEGNFPGVVEAQLGKSHGKTHGKTMEDEDLNLRFSSTMVYQVYPMEKKHWSKWCGMGFKHDKWIQMVVQASDNRIGWRWDGHAVEEAYEHASPSANHQLLVDQAMRLQILWMQDMMYPRTHFSQRTSRATASQLRNCGWLNASILKPTRLQLQHSTNLVHAATSILHLR